MLGEKEFEIEYDCKDFNENNMIGKGAFADVFRVKNKTTSKFYACRIETISEDNNDRV